MAASRMPGNGLLFGGGGAQTRPLLPLGLPAMWRRLRSGCRRLSRRCTHWSLTCARGPLEAALLQQEGPVRVPAAIFAAPPVCPAHAAGSRPLGICWSVYPSPPMRLRPLLRSACEEIVAGAGRAKREVDTSRHGLKAALRCACKAVRPCEACVPACLRLPAVLLSKAIAEPACAV